MTDPFFKEMVKVMKEIAPTWHTQDMHAIMQRFHEAYQLKKPMCFEIREDTPDDMQSMLFLWQHNPEGVPTTSDKRMMGHSTCLMLTSGCG